MDIVVNKGDQLIIQTDVIDDANNAVDLDGADVHYMLQDEVALTFPVDEDEGDSGIELNEIEGVKSQVQITIDIDFGPGRFRQEGKAKVGDLGPFTIIEGTIFVMPSLIEADV